jgi:hypothetical protein
LTVLHIAFLYCCISGALNPDPCIRTSCLNTVDFPESAVPNNIILLDPACSFFISAASAFNCLSMDDDSCLADRTSEMGLLSGEVSLLMSSVVDASFFIGTLSKFGELMEYKISLVYRKVLRLVDDNLHDLLAHASFC